MNHIEQQKKSLGEYFSKVLAKKTIYKSDILSLKKKATALAAYDSSFNSLRNSITTHANAMKGTLNQERRIKINELFQKHFC